MATAPTASSPAPARPQFYSRPVPLSPQTFKGKSFLPSATYAFARKTNAVPLNAAEFALAQRHYPIVFGAGDEPIPMAIVGVRKDENLFVGADGRWRADTYVPAYVRRYPFILMGNPGGKQFLLCADVEAEHVVDGDTNPFFRDDGPSQVVRNATAFCRVFQADADRTRAFCTALAEQNLYRAKTAELSHPGGQKIKLGPFRMVDEKKFADLPGKIVTDWHSRGWLRVIHAHLFSLANWSSLANRFAAP